VVVGKTQTLATILKADGQIQVVVNWGLFRGVAAALGSLFGPPHKPWRQSMPGVESNLNGV
jgi:hypothetical protein